jgi:hypothetical protein
VSPTKTLQIIFLRTRRYNAQALSRICHAIRMATQSCRLCAAHHSITYLKNRKEEDREEGSDPRWYGCAVIELLNWHCRI